MRAVLVNDSTFFFSVMGDDKKVLVKPPFSPFFPSTTQAGF